MKFFIGITDNGWYNYLADLQPDEVNFWQPGATGFRALEPGEPFLFKLHYPEHFIVGGGFFVRYTQLPLSLIWEAFGEKNGAGDFNTLYNLIMSRRSGHDKIEHNPSVGCIILNNPFFFPRELWIEPPIDLKKNVVRGKTYDTQTYTGREIWRKVEHNLHMLSYKLIATSDETMVSEGEPYGNYYLQRARFGQGTFRVLVTDAYQRKCSITGERTLPALDAAHIKPFAESGSNKISNGLLLRSDIHKLFDKGYITITTDYRIEVSRRIKEEYENGREYYAFQGKTLTVIPVNQEEQPSVEFLEWHNQQRFIG
jgi:putative restriction endonuclease